MSFFSAIKQMLGIDPSYDNDESIADAPEAASTSVQTQQNESSDTAELPSVDPQTKARIFKGVVEIFNQSLPDFLARSVDPEAQMRLLAEALDKSLDDYLNDLMHRSEQYAESRLKTAVDASRREAQRLRDEMQQLDQQRNTLREQQLSADRRRRALADRVADLEGKLESCEAEREQYQLENKSLLNKLKVADLQPGIVDDLNKQIEELRARLKQAEETATQALPEVSPVEEELRNRCAALEEQLTQAQAEASQHAADCRAAESQINDLHSTIANLKEQQKMSEAMYNDLSRLYAEERDAGSAARAKVAEAEETIKGIAEIQSQLTEVETIIRKRDERIERLKATNRKLRDDLNRLKEADNLFNEGTAQAEPKVINPEMAAIEDDFECPDWFVAEPAPDHVALRNDNTEPFGYQEPTRKPRRPENDAQLSLF